MVAQNLLSLIMLHNCNVIFKKTALVSLNYLKLNDLIFKKHNIKNKHVKSFAHLTTTCSTTTELVYVLEDNQCMRLWASQYKCSESFTYGQLYASKSYG